MKLRKEARGEMCQIRVPGVCTFDPETTVGCHYRLIGASGMSMKSPDVLIAWGCARCHEYCDTHHDEETKLYLAEGVLRTLVILWNRGTVRAA